jgi:hypothetical protein
VRKARRRREGVSEDIFDNVGPVYSEMPMDKMKREEYFVVPDDKT